MKVTPGTHASELDGTSFWKLIYSVNKQLNDKERVAAALENTHLLGVVNGCLTKNED